MKQKILLLLAAGVFAAGANAQKKSKPVTAYAITAVEKGNSRWTEVKLVDVNTGEEVQSIYQSAEEVPTLNARTGKPIAKKEATAKQSSDHEVLVIRSTSKTPMTEADLKELSAKLKVEGNVKIRIENGTSVHEINKTPGTEGAKRVYVMRKTSRITSNAPFATQSAACAYDKKHERLYYTPMGINQLRYIDLKSKTPQIFYFEDEPFGALSGPGDVQNQITRMVIGGDGNGYALTNNAEHLIRFTTGKKAVITDLGGLTDAGSNKVSIHSKGGYGGDIIADNSGNLYLITANRSVFKIDISTRIATYLGSITGLPRGFTTNGAVVEKGTNIIVTSSTSTSGYYMFDLNTLEAKKISSSETVFNASDLANSNLISDKKVKKDRKVEEIAQQVPQVEEEQTDPETGKRIPVTESGTQLTVFPNPVTNNVVNLSFADYAQGRYEIQVLDLNGKIIHDQNMTLYAKSQVQEVRLPVAIAKGSYLIKVISETGKVMNVEKIVVQ